MAPKRSRQRFDETELQRVRRQNLGRLSSVLAVDFQARVLAGLHARGHQAIRLTHNAVLMNVGIEGTRQSELARRAGVTRQAIGQLVDELEQLGYVERTCDPSDGRAQLVRFSERGRALLDEGAAIIREVEADYAARLGGPSELEVVRGVLTRLVESLGLELP